MHLDTHGVIIVIITIIVIVIVIIIGSIIIVIIIIMKTNYEKIIIINVKLIKVLVGCVTPNTALDLTGEQVKYL